MAISLPVYEVINNPVEGSGNKGVTSRKDPFEYHPDGSSGKPHHNISQVFSYWRRDEVDAGETLRWASLPMISAYRSWA